MKEENKIWILFVVFAGGFLIGGLTLWSQTGFIRSVVNRDRTTTDLATLENEICKDTLSQFSKLFQATSEVGQIPYDANFTDCYDHSKLLTQKLAEKNIRSSIMVNKDRSHAWVAVWIEATSGQFVPIKNGEQELLEVRDGTDITNVQCYNQ